MQSSNKMSEKIIISGTKSEAYDEEGNPVDCGLEDAKNKAKPDGYEGPSKVQDTSKQAKKEIDVSGVSKTQREWIFQVIKNSNAGLTISEINDLTGLQKSSISPRVNELSELKKIYNSGTRMHKGKNGIVWMAN